MRSRLLTSHLTEIEPDILALCSRPQDYDENDKFKMMMNRIYGMLKAVFRTEDNVYILPASFDTLDEIMLLNFLPSDGYAATLKTANYETDILQAAEQFGCTKNVVEIDFRDGKLSSIEKALQKNEDIDILFLPYCEDTVDLNGNEVKFKAAGRHDPCVVPRAIPVVESMAAMTILDYYLLNKTIKL